MVILSKQSYSKKMTQLKNLMKLNTNTLIPEPLISSQVVIQQ